MLHTPSVYPQPNNPLTTRIILTIEQAAWLSAFLKCELTRLKEDATVFVEDEDFYNANQLGEQMAVLKIIVHILTEPAGVVRTSSPLHRVCIFTRDQITWLRAFIQVERVRLLDDSLLFVGDEEMQFICNEGLAYCESCLKVVGQ